VKKNALIQALKKTLGSGHQVFRWSLDLVIFNFGASRSGLVPKYSPNV